jgi:2-polyprenyl-6-hydroxyphenyl methylase/3-demethylubiquinone-9 3-methyltransferase
MSNVDPVEIARFDAVAEQWWDPDGEMRPLHDLNPVRLAYVERSGDLAQRLVLDVGCGGGLLSEAMARRGARVTGLDLAGEVLAAAERHAAASGLSIEYRLESAEAHAQASPGRYDVVTCMEMLEHVPDPGTVIAALAALIRPGGHLFLSTINRTPRAYLRAVVAAEYILRLLPAGTHSYEKFIRPSELVGWARAAGLELVDVSGIDYDPFARRARLTTDARVNYLVQLQRPAADANTP